MKYGCQVTDKIKRKNEICIISIKKLKCNLFVLLEHIYKISTKIIDLI